MRQQLLTAMSAAFILSACDSSTTALSATGASSSPPRAGEPSLPTITVVALDPQASESGADTGTFFIARTGGRIEAPLSVTVASSGTASAGADYTAPPLKVNFDPHVPMVNFVITPKLDMVEEGAETVMLEIVPEAGTYLAGDQKRATVTIADASGGGTNQHRPQPTEPGTPAQPPDNPGTPQKVSGFPIGQGLPRDKDGRVILGGQRTGTLVVTVSFDGTGKWSDPETGANTTTIAHRKIEYTVPLEGMYSYGSGFQEIEKREAAASGMMLPIPNRYLVLRPRIGAAGTPCGTGTIEFKDVSRGLSVGDPGMPGLVPFQREIRGGGRYPSGDKTIPERDLCETAVTLDFGKQVMHLRIDGTDTYVKVQDIYDGRLHGVYNLKLQGEDGGHAKSKLTFFDLPLKDGDAASGFHVIREFIAETGPNHSTFPLTANVSWKLTLE